MADRKEIFRIVKQRIDEWNPYSLLDLGCPMDEFDLESHSVADAILFDSSRIHIVAVISAVFSNAFERELFTIDRCEEVADKIFRDLQKMYIGLPVE